MRFTKFFLRFSLFHSSIIKFDRSALSRGVRVPQFNFAYGVMQFASGRKPANGTGDDDDDDDGGRRKPRGFRRLSHSIHLVVFAVAANDAWRQRCAGGRKLNLLYLTGKCEAFVRALSRITVCYSRSRTAKSFPSSSLYVELTVRVL